MKPMQDSNYEIIDISFPIPIFAIYMPIAILFLKKYIHCYFQGVILTPL